jgi:hypothetical protein
VLCLASQRAKDRPCVRLSQELGQIAQVGAQVTAKIAGILRRQVLDRIVKEGVQLVVGDDSSFPSMTDYLNYVRDPANGYVSVEFPVEDGMEISCRSGVHGEATK